jgi:hypothetical protein
MNQSDSGIENPSREPFNKNVSQIRDQTITSLVGFYFSSIIVAVIVTTIQIWVPARLGISGISKDILAPVVAAIGVTFSYGFIKDKIAAEFDAGTKSLESEVEKKSFEKNQKILEDNRKVLEDNRKVLEQIDESNIKYYSDFKYLAYIKPIMGFNKLRLFEVSSKLTQECGQDNSAFEKQLDIELEGNKNTREVRHLVHSLSDDFLQQLAIEGIAEALHLEPDDASERTNLGNDLRPLRVDIYAYLSAWLICSIDNDMGVLMPMDCIGMEYKGEGNIPDKETYKNVIQAIREIIDKDKYVTFIDYPGDEPLLILVKSTIIDYLGQFIDLIDKYPLGAVEF